MPGLIIALEGLDGTGKTTIAAPLARRLGAIHLRTPGSELRAARHIFDGSDPLAAQLFYAASVMRVSAQARELAASHQDVVIDRYWLSTLVNAPLRGQALGLDEVERALTPADLTFLLELDETERHARLHERGTNAHDGQTMQPAVARALRSAYRRGLERPVAGLGSVIEATGMNVAALVDRLALEAETLGRNARSRQ